MDYTNNTNQDDLSANLQNYSIQLQQVNLALTSDPNNEEMLKLKEDLEEVINLTKELIQPTKPTSLATTSSLKAGQRVLAPYSVDGLYYEARVDDITSDGQCTVFFAATVLPETNDSKKTKGISEVCLTSLLKPLNSSGGGSKSWDNQRGSSSSKSSSNKTSSSQSRESLKKKQQKRQTKIKELEEEREKDKAKWQTFAKKKKISNKSIFSSPDSVEGRVGVGTCGISGKPMTSYCNSSSSVGSVPVKKKVLSSGFPSSTSTSSSKNQ